MVSEADVSILVLVDVPLKQVEWPDVPVHLFGFNPCFGGCSIKTVAALWVPARRLVGFNPCFGGCSIKTSIKS